MQGWGRRTGLLLLVGGAVAVLREEREHLGDLQGARNTVSRDGVSRTTLEAEVIRSEGRERILIGQIISGIEDRVSTRV